MTYAGLVEKLAAIGVDEKEANVRNKLSRGKFTAAFLLQCLEAIGVNELRVQLPDDDFCLALCFLDVPGC